MKCRENKESEICFQQTRDKNTKGNHWWKPQPHSDKGNAVNKTESSLALSKKTPRKTYGKNPTGSRFFQRKIR